MKLKKKKDGKRELKLIEIIDLFACLRVNGRLEVSAERHVNEVVLLKLSFKMNTIMGELENMIVSLRVRGGKSPVSVLKGCYRPYRKKIFPEEWLYYEKYKGKDNRCIKNEYLTIPSILKWWEEIKEEQIKNLEDAIKFSEGALNRMEILKKLGGMGNG